MSGKTRLKGTTDNRSIKLTMVKIHPTRMDMVMLYIILFIYVFAFYLGPISSSLLIGFGMWGIAILDKGFRSSCLITINKPLIINLVKWLILVIITGCFFSIIHLTLDFSFLKVFLAQIIHLIAAIPVLSYLSHKKYTTSNVESAFIGIFVIQTLIQCIVSSFPALRETMFIFNHFDPESVVGLGNNFRGSALSAATTYHLTLAYGICFIIYVKHYFMRKINFKSVLVGILIFVGIFFAGRSGFIGCLIALTGYLFIPKKFLHYSKTVNIFRVLIITFFTVTILISILAVVSPNFYNLLDKYILPYAFEFIYNYQNAGSAETASTNELAKMWSYNFNPTEFIVGSGHFTDPDGKYYMHVDPGILRHLLYFGIIGYIVLLLYQYMAIPFFKMRGPTRFFCFLIYLFILIMDFKGVTLGGNKFMIFIPLLLSYTYLYLPKESKSNVENSIYNGIST